MYPQQRGHQQWVCIRAVSYRDYRLNLVLCRLGKADRSLKDGMRVSATPNEYLSAACEFNSSLGTNRYR